MEAIRNRFLAKRLLIVCGVLALVFLSGPAVADGENSAPQLPPEAHIIQGAESSAPVAPQSFDGDLRDLPRAPEPAPGAPVIEIPRRVYPREKPAGPGQKQAAEPESMLDPLLWGTAGVEEADADRALDAEDSLRVFQTPDLNVAGQDFTGVVPPDTVGDVGRNHYIQMTNHPSGSIFTIRNKQTGAVMAGPALLKDLATGGACTIGHGDPIVLFDNIANRWLLSEFASTGNHLCVYVSKTSDPIAGGWWSYDFAVPFFPDYQKYAVWPDAYFVSSNEPTPAAYALDRNRMLSGLAATFQRFTATDLAGFGFQALLPADLDGNTQPPAGSPGYFIRHRDDEVHNAPGTAQDFLEIWKFKVDFTTPANSTFTGPFNIAVAEFDSSLCGLSSFNCFPQPGTSVTLDPLREVVMWRAQYRNFGDHEALVGNFVTDVNGANRGGIRWFELRKDVSAATNWGLFQEGTFAQGSVDNRWMGSIAMDRGGNMALGYSISSSSTNPGIRYTGRLDTTPPGIMFAETTVVNGPSYSSTNRWGDYSSMNVDPVDDCTFWYTNEYAKDNHQWTTQIARFAHDSCFGPCCNTHPYPGCADKTIQAAVCAVDPFCCNVEWDSICVGRVTSAAGDSCDCCEGHADATGCYVPGLPVVQRQDVSDCVCEIDPFCCDVNWDGVCASEVESLGCGICPDDCPPPGAATSPLPANNALDVKVNSILSWNCGLADSYEDQALSEYTAVGSGGVYTVTTPASHDGFYGLEGSQAGGWIYRDDPDAVVAQGETLSFWVRPKSNEGRAYVGFGASAAGTYSVAVAPNTGQFLLQRNDSYGYLDIGSSAQTWQNKWYRVEVRWGAGGQITATLFDQDGKTVLNSVSALDNTYTAGGIAFRAFNGPKFLDTVQVCPSPVPEVAAISEALKSRFSYYRETEPPEAVPGERDNLVWDEANQGYASPESLQPVHQPAETMTVIPEGYSIQNGMLVEGQVEPSIPSDESAPQREAPANRNVSTNIINFDDVTAPCSFPETTRLTDQYADRGVIFAGPGGNDGGAILNECGNFSVSGQSSPNFLAFNTGSSLSDGGIPRGPESIFFATPVSEVQANVANGAASGTVTMAAYDAANALVDTMTLTLSAVLRPISVAGENIVRVVVSSTASVFVLDDLTWAQWCPITYDVFFGTANPPTTKICSDIQTTFCDPPGNLAESTPYFWRVVTKNPGGSNSGPVWNFTTGQFCECDLNNSGNCNILDYQLFIQDWGKTTCNNPGVFCECDLNVDGACNILDYQLFIQNWGQSGCSAAPARCAPQTCGNYTFDCNPASSSCLCVEAAEGFGSCVQNRGCPPAAECTTSDDCSFGSICAVNTCCGVGICVPDNACADVGLSPETLLEGPTMSGR